MTVRPHVPSPRMALLLSLADEELTVTELEQRDSWYRWQYLRTRHWRELTQAVRARAGNACEVCGHPATSRRDPAHVLHVHHVTYDRVGEERLEDVQAVCASCHSTVHVSNRPAGTRRATRPTGRRAC